MGATFAGVHVRSTDLEAIRSRIEALRGPLVDAAPDEPADRTLVIAPGDAWTSIADDAAIDDDALTDLAAAVAPLGAVLTARVFDSDELWLTLTVGSERATFTRGKGSVRSHLARWQALLPDAPADALRETFAADHLFAEAALDPLARALGMAPGALAIDDVPATAIVLRWRHASRPAWQTPLTGPPVLQLPERYLASTHGHVPQAAAPRPIEVAVGGPVQLTVGLISAAGPGDGVAIVVEAPPIVRFERARVVSGDPRAARVAEVPLVARDGAWVADVEVPVPAGRDLRDVADAPPLAIQAAVTERQLHVGLFGTGVSAGDALVAVTVTPRGGTGDGGRLRVVVQATDDRPLRAAPTVHPSALAPLRDPAWSVAIVALHARDRAAVDALARALAPPSDGKARVTLYGGLKAPKLTSGKAAGFLDGPRWQAALDAAASQVDVDWGDDRDPVARIELGHGLIPGPDPAFVVAAGARGDRVDALVAAVDALPGVIQALVTRWGHPPSGEFTPYEQACGVMGQCTRERAWVTRWLRGLGPGVVWLGDELRAHVPHAPARLAVTDVRAAEALLAPILPSSDDWRAGVAHRYGR